MSPRAGATAARLEQLYPPYIPLTDLLRIAIALVWNSLLEKRPSAFPFLLFCLFYSICRLETLQMSWKDTNTHNRILRDAEAGQYGVIAAIAYNVEQIFGLVKAAKNARSPLIIQFFPWAIEVYDGLLVRTAADAAKTAGVPISIHLDHAQSEDIIKRAAELPFDSIMVDMSHYGKEINLKKTAELVEYCNQRHKATEAEPGRIEGGEDGVMDTAGLEACMTTPEEIEEFVATGVDSLAPAFGNVHGEYGLSGPRLDFGRYRILFSPI
jgi:fructose-bisphosphate aldolase class II